jgi:hypothetical protein
MMEGSVSFWAKHLAWVKEKITLAKIANLFKLKIFISKLFGHFTYAEGTEQSFFNWSPLFFVQQYSNCLIKLRNKFDK